MIEREKPHGPGAFNFTFSGETGKRRLIYRRKFLSNCRREVHPHGKHLARLSSMFKREKGESDLWNEGEK